MRRILAGVLALGMFGGGLLLFETTLVDAEEGEQVKGLEEVQPAGPHHEYEVEHDCKFLWDGDRPPPPWLVGRWDGESPQHCVPKPDCEIFWHYVLMEDGLGPNLDRTKAVPVDEFPCKPPPCEVIRRPLAATQDNLERPPFPCKPPPCEILRVPAAAGTQADQVRPVDCCRFPIEGAQSLIDPCPAD